MTNHPSTNARTASALTLAAGRDAHLRNVILGLCEQTTPPIELIIGVMQDALFEDLPDAPFPIRQIRIVSDELPLAWARNTVAAAASGELLVFLDVDCIPHTSLISDYTMASYICPGLLMGEVMYLPGGAAASGWTYPEFDAVAVRHCDRHGRPADGFRRCEDYRCFWSLNFAMRRQDWDASGGFDPRFQGYGGEDTDFGRALDEKNIPIWWIAGAKVYHQYHPHCMPPIHHVPSIIRNAEIFASKWGHRTMEHWLNAFRIMGLIEPHDGTFRQIRMPDADDFALCAQSADTPYSATSWVLRKLEAQAASASKQADGVAGAPDPAPATLK